MSLFGRLREQLESDWRSQARPEQVIPASNTWTVWLYLAGRGAGKTRSGAEAVREEVESGRCGRVALIAPTAADARDVMLEGPSGILTVYPTSSRPLYEPTKRRITFRNGAIATLYSAEQADRLRGPQHDLLWGDEVAAWPDAQSVWDMAMFGLRVGRRPRAIVTTTPRPIKLIRDLLKRSGEDVVVTRGRTADNAENLAPGFISQIVGRYQGTRLGRQELEGELLEDVEGALWTGELIEKGRIDKSALPELKRIVVAIDPAMTTGETANETGLIVAGADDRDDHAYVLEDASGRYAPIEWARKAVELYHRHHADRIVAEVNQGGAMCESTVRMVDPNVAYKAVSASRGKITRAEPVAALYEQGRVHHVGIFPELEDQLCSFAPGMPGSPDRGDALVWALSELLVENRNSSLGFLNFYASQAGGGVAAPGGSPLERVVLLKPPAGCGGAHLASGRSVSTWGEPVAMLESDARPLLASGWSRAPSNLSPQ